MSVCSSSPNVKCDNRILPGLVRTYYKTRLEVFFNHYASKNFGGRPWSQLSEVILVRHDSLRVSTNTDAS